MGVIGNTLLEGECHYNQIEARLIKEWVNDDRLDRLGLKRVEDIEAHRTNDRTYPLHGRFSGISQDVYYNNQPEYFIEGYGVSGLNFKRFAKVRLASSPIRLYVNLADILKPLSKNARHKATRYKRIPITLQARIDYACLRAVKDFKG